ncbi:MAG: hypothetical protein KC505_10990, partial [Myxococcales bacterium]|nr:hypothetical protein [Myxococcales bacterium]
FKDNKALSTQQEVLEALAQKDDWSLLAMREFAQISQHFFSSRGFHLIGSGRHNNQKDPYYWQLVTRAGDNFKEPEIRFEQPYSEDRAKTFVDELKNCDNKPSSFTWSCEASKLKSFIDDGHGIRRVVAVRGNYINFTDFAVRANQAEISDFFGSILKNVRYVERNFHKEVFISNKSGFGQLTPHLYFLIWSQEL